MLRILALAGAAALALVSIASPSQAQSEADFVAAFAGDWQTLDPALAAGGACRITLDPERAAETYRIRSANCGGALAGLDGWGIVDNQLGLLGADAAVLARLGGNQKRMSGDLSGGGTVVFERLPPGTGQAAAAVPDTEGCIFYGYTASCAAPEDRAPPAPAGADNQSRVAVLVQLNARAEARPDAPVVATIPAGTCVVVDRCTKASDGNWCRAQVSNYTGWIRQQAVRRDRWPVLTYAPGC